MLHQHETNQSHENIFMDSSDDKLDTIIMSEGKGSKQKATKSVHVQFFEPARIDFAQVVASPAKEEFKMFDAKAVARRSVLARKIAHVSVQTDPDLEFEAKMKRAEQIWENCLDTTTKMKFEELRS